jgi:hypothetical protein
MVAAATLLIAALVTASQAADSTVRVATGTILEPAEWDGPQLGGSSPNANVAIASSDSTPAASSQLAAKNPLRVALQPGPPLPPQTIQVVPQPPATNVIPVQPVVPPQQLPLPNSSRVVVPTQPLPDGAPARDEFMSAAEENEGCIGGGDQLHVRPYGGGHPTDWSWGCNGSPYRTGPGMCDNYKVGPRWHITFDGLVMSRDETDLIGLQNFMTGPDSFVQGGTTGNPQVENFDHGPGGRVTFTSEVPRFVGYQIQGAYEGIIDWDASIVFPKEPDSVSGIVGSSTQRSLHYTSDYNSAEVSWVRSCDDNWHPFCGFRYIKVGERLNDFLDEVAPPPLPGNPPAPPNPVITTDLKNLIDIDNNLMGFQVGMLHEAWCVTRRFTVEGFVNGGVYYNKVKYFNRMGTYTTQVGVDNPATPNFNEAGTFFSVAVNDDQSDLAEIAYTAEASLSGVCRLNKCWALRTGYQILWIKGVHLADDAYLGLNNSSNDLLFHGWHAGFECRR